MWPWHWLSDLDLGCVTLTKVMWSPGGIEGQKAWNRPLWVIIFDDPFRSKFDVKTYSFWFISDCVGPHWKVSEVEKDSTTSAEKNIAPRQVYNFLLFFSLFDIWAPRKVPNLLKIVLNWSKCIKNKFPQSLEWFRVSWLILLRKKAKGRWGQLCTILVIFLTSIACILNSLLWCPWMT